MPENIVEDVGKGVDYFKKLKKGRRPLEEKMEDMLEGTPPPPKPVPEKELKERSTKGSAPFSEAELRKGYRKI